MNRPVVLDASALLAVFFKEIGATTVLDSMRDSGGNCFIHGVNACEVAYVLMRKGVPRQAAWRSSPPPGVHQIDDIKGPLEEKVVDLKNRYGFLSLGDCFAMALAEYLGGGILTSDKRFAEVETTALVTMIR